MRVDRALIALASIFPLVFKAGFRSFQHSQTNDFHIFDLFMKNPLLGKKRLTNTSAPGSKGRRQFLKQASLMSAAALAAPAISMLGLSGCSGEQPQPEATAETAGGSGATPFGIQLWTLREAFPENPREVLQQLAGFGYRQIETFEGAEGMFWGMGHREMKTFIEDLGMQLVSGHCNVMENFEQKVEQAAEIGMEYLVAPYLGPQESLDDYRRTAEIYNEKGRLCREAGLRFAYHNHEYTFMPHADTEVLPQDIFMQETDPERVEFEMDVYWVVTAGQDPAAWMRKYPGRFTLGHIKDRAEVGADVMRASTTLGTGIIDFAQFLPLAKEHGMKRFFVEQEEYEGITPIAAAEAGAAYMSKLPGFSS